MSIPTLSSNSTLDGVGGQPHDPTALTPGKDLVPIVGWVQGPVWTCAENLAPIRIRTPGRPAGSE
jgi:hypothetical protein